MLLPSVGHCMCSTINMFWGGGGGVFYIVELCSEITRGRVLNGEARASCTKISEINLSTYIYRLFHEDFFSIIRTVPMSEEKSS